VLNPITAPSTATPVPSASVGTLAILPVTVPDYLDRREIVSRTADHRLQISDRETWGEGLSGGLARVLTVDLGKLLAKDGFVVTSGAHQRKVDAELSLTIDAFERDADGNAVLAARWMIVDERRSGAIMHFQAVYSEPVRAAVSGSAYAAAVVTALNRGLDRLAVDIAESVRELRRTSPR
jgi:uncharacterized lipoprotein YmbA